MVELSRESWSTSKDLERPRMHMCGTVCYNQNLGKHKWGLICAYQHPLLSSNVFEHDVSSTLDKICIGFDRVFVICDWNYDMFEPDKKKPVEHLSETWFKEFY